MAGPDAIPAGAATPEALTDANADRAKRELGTAIEALRNDYPLLIQRSPDIGAAINAIERRVGDIEAGAPITIHDTLLEEIAAQRAALVAREQEVGPSLPP